MAEFLEEFNKPFFDSKGEQFLPCAEPSFYQEVSISPPNRTDLFNSQVFLEFKELYESGKYLYDDNRPQGVVINKRSELILSIKQEAEEEKKEEENLKNKNKKWRTKNKNKKWTKK